MGPLTSGPRHRFTVVVVSAVVAFAGLIAGSPAKAAPACTTPTVYPESDVTAGLVGTGYTVLHGTTQSSFDVRVLGIQHDFELPGHDLYEVKVTGPNSFLDATGGIVAGMSGSPVYVTVGLNQELLGAVAYGYYFANHKIGFLTTGQDIVNLFSYPNTSAAFVASMPQRFAVSDHLRRTTARSLGVKLSTVPDTAQAVPLPMGFSGVDPNLLQKVNSALQQHGLKTFDGPSMYSAGSAPISGALNPAPIQPGDSFMGILSSGDVSAWGGGTAVACNGSATIAFGHPFFFDGPTSMGESGGKILTIVRDPSGITGGFKEMIPGSLHGTVTQDRYAGIVGVAGTSPGDVSVTTDFSNPDLSTSLSGETDIYYQGVKYAVPDLAGYHVFASLLSVLDGFSAGTVSIDYTITGTAGGIPFTVTNRNMAYNSYFALEGAYKLIDALYILAFNRFEPVTFTGVNATGSITTQELVGTITNIRSESALNPNLRVHPVLKVKAGREVTLVATLELPDGSKQYATVHLKAPRGARGFSRVSMRGGKAREFFDFRDAGSFDQLVAALNGGEHPNDLITKGLGSHQSEEQDVVVSGRGSQEIKVVPRARLGATVR